VLAAHSLEEDEGGCEAWIEVQLCDLKDRDVVDDLYLRPMPAAQDQHQRNLDSQVGFCSVGRLH
jgi:hypothetical protein